MNRNCALITKQREEAVSMANHVAKGEKVIIIFKCFILFVAKFLAFTGSFVLEFCHCGFLERCSLDNKHASTDITANRSERETLKQTKIGGNYPPT